MAINFPTEDVETPVHVHAVNPRLAVFEAVALSRVR